MDIQDKDKPMKTNKMTWKAGREKKNEDCHPRINNKTDSWFLNANDGGQKTIKLQRWYLQAITRPLIAQGWNSLQTAFEIKIIHFRQTNTIGINLSKPTWKLVLESLLST